VDIVEAMVVLIKQTIRACEMPAIAGNFHFLRACFSTKLTAILLSWWWHTNARKMSAFPGNFGFAMMISFF
jgi:hypothetical protein